jgi:hypothetical protein
VQNGRGGGGGYSTDDFGKELIVANKRKYQLESRVKQIEMELKEAQQVKYKLNKICNLPKNLKLPKRL